MALLALLLIAAPVSGAAILLKLFGGNGKSHVGRDNAEVKKHAERLTELEKNEEVDRVKNDAALEKIHTKLESVSMRIVHVETSIKERSDESHSKLDALAVSMEMIARALGKKVGA